MFLELCEAASMCFVVIASECLMAVNTNEGCRPTATVGVFLRLFFLESSITVGAYEGDHGC